MAQRDYALVYNQGANQYQIYAGFEGRRQLIFYWNTQMKKCYRPTVERESRQAQPDCEVLSLDEETALLKIGQHIAQIVWDKKRRIRDTNVVLNGPILRFTEFTLADIPGANRRTNITVKELGLI
jgi:hypothetical protein